MEEIDIKRKAHEFRIDILNMIHKANSGHTGGSLSAIDIITTLYFGESKGKKFLNTDPKNPDWTDQDYFILSKGHSCPALYVILADLGFFPKEELNHFRQMGALLQGHPVRKTPGVTMTTGTLGSGISAAVGLAMCLKMEKKPNKVYVMVGDGEFQEGIVWEALMAAGHHKLDNLVVILDNNGVQMDGYVRSVMSIDPVVDKFDAFGFLTLQVMDGHNISDLLKAFSKAVDNPRKPVAIVANTIKGKGVSFAEGKASYHGVALSKEEMAVAVPAIQNIINDCK
ncbi:MAG: transketolase, transketolase [Candidatus Peregrinibacteria bacterium GW2011_GWF2_38_29]|nr:MAG: transketolase, transketolase [Candidatus Peregrinibacteria bacterium GW2011_GWF2_38_29]HBB03126.1 transketolase [Candidatus Peregrinibacteria bacterium]